ncbi:hypothetical protein [Rhodoferax sp.]|uniref:hypothetical protein n=1 Tax=Rhodoferax sp. TaxID=50421 RepID=UPI0025F3FAD9|nr:hypothetical protein [Rhodoferax sp.]MCM2295498.1 hypothetical protein [Rhodoferax sp.]
MKEFRLKGSWSIAKSITLASVVVSGSAFGEFDTPHYLGSSRDHNEFKVYLHGGVFLGQTESMHTIKVTVQQVRKGRLFRSLEGCVYRFDESNRLRDRIECSVSTPGPLSGVEYARDLKQITKGAHELDLLVCVRRCGRQVPQRLSLEGADEDNG